MRINPLIKEILQQYNIDISLGTLVLLGIYFNLDINKVYSEETIKSINLTKIVDKDYNTNTIIWNIPLFEGQEVGAFDWVNDWISAFGKINPERKGSFRDAIPRMKAFFAANPEYRKEDVYKARDAYFRTIRDPQYLMKSHKFIYDGIGAMKKSTLLEWCEKVTTSNINTNNMKGKIIK